MKDTVNYFLHLNEIFYCFAFTLWEKDSESFVYLHPKKKKKKIRIAILSRETSLVLETKDVGSISVSETYSLSDKVTSPLCVSVLFMCKILFWTQWTTSKSELALVMLLPTSWQTSATNFSTINHGTKTQSQHHCQNHPPRSNK